MNEVYFGMKVFEFLEIEGNHINNLNLIQYNLESLSTLSCAIQEYGSAVTKLNPPLSKEQRELLRLNLSLRIFPQFKDL